MIIVKLMGGLGNQLFQYALGRRLALEREIPLLLDLSWFQTQKKRKFELDSLNISAEIATEEVIYRVRYFSYNPYLRKANSFFQHLLPYWRKRVINEISNGIFDPSILRAPKNCLLCGYWQSEKYFHPISSIIRSEFTLKKSENYEMEGLVKEMQTFNSVSVHIRRGDYYSDPEINKSHGILPVDYYLTAMKLLQEQTGKSHFYVFSDDLQWVKENIKLDAPCTYVESKPTNTDFEEIWLMSKCRHHIIANSSFSWWGAWLGISPDKLVISPKAWFPDPKRIAGDLIPENWIKL